jgi:hypothetical protein
MKATKAKIPTHSIQRMTYRWGRNSGLKKASRLDDNGVPDLRMEALISRQKKTAAKYNHNA